MMPRSSVFGCDSEGGVPLKNPKHPRLRAELLALRSQEYARTAEHDHEACARAIEDATRAVGLMPDWPQAHRVLANALDVSGRFSEAAERLKIAMAMGKGLDPNLTELILERLEQGIPKCDAEVVEIKLEETPPLYHTLRDNKYDHLVEVDKKPLLPLWLLPPFAQRWSFCTTPVVDYDDDSDDPTVTVEVDKGFKEADADDADDERSTSCGSNEESFRSPRSQLPSFGSEWETFGCVDLNEPTETEEIPSTRVPPALSTALLLHPRA